MSNSSQPQKIGKAVFKYIRTLPNNKSRKLIELNLFWKQIVGEPIGKHTTVVEYRPNGTITIKVTNPVWMQPLQQSKQYIINRLDKSVSGSLKIKRLELISNEKENQPTEQRRKKGDPIKEDHSVIEAISSIPDEALRSVLLKVYRIKLSKTN